MKIVINTCYGGFGLSDKAILRYAELKRIILYRHLSENHFYNSPDFTEETYFSLYDIPRDSVELVQAVEELKEESNGGFSKLKVVEVPDDVDWTIEEYDGLEWVAEVHRTWS